MALAILALHACLMGLAQCDTDEDGDGWTPLEGDCDDQDPQTYPEAPELCDGLDNDCDGEVDDGLDQSVWYEDRDGDGYGVDGSSMVSCEQPEGYAAETGDCDDGDAAVYPGNPEVCDGKDNNCNQMQDEGLYSEFFLDEDGDHFGTTVDTVVDCTPPIGYASRQGDCDDSDPLVNPARAESCESGGADGIDNNCDGRVDETLKGGWYPDLDGDGFGDSSQPSCEDGTDLIPYGGDCDDGNAAAYPGALDSDGDGVDQDCGGRDGPQPSVGLETSSFAAIQDALNAAVDGDVVWIGPGTYREHGLSFNGKGIRLASTDGLAVTIIDGESLESVFLFTEGEGPDAVLEGFTVTGGSAQAGGGIFVDGSSPTLFSCTLRANLASQEGGGIFLRDSSATLREVSLEGNQASQGGGFYALRGTPILTSVRLRENDASNSGGGLYSEAAELIMADSWIEENRASVSGGGWFGADEGGYAMATIFEGNSAISAGGGIALEGGDVRLEGVSLRMNLSWSNGGGLMAKSGSLEISSGTISSNWAMEMGGGLYVSAQYLSISGSEFLLNQVDASGGGLAVASNSVLEMSQSSLESNSAAEEGGGTHGENSEMTFRETLFSGNSADGLGGGVNAISSVLTLESVTLTDNGAYAGAGVAVRDASLAAVDSTFSANMATRYGGGAYLDGSPLVMTGTVLEDNAAEHGGGLYLNWVDGELSSSSFLRNKASLDGAGASVVDGTLIILDTHFEGNAALDDCGALRLYGGTVQLTRAIFVENTAADVGGAICFLDLGSAVSDTTFQDNSARYAGGGYIYGGGSTLENTVFSGNQASKGGGGLYLDDTNVHVSSSEFLANVAENGGGIYMDFAIVNVANGSFDANQALESGGGLFTRGSSNVQVKNCTLVDNVAISGGGVYAEGTSTQLTFLNSNVSFNAGLNVFNATAAPATILVNYSNLFSYGKSHNLALLNETNLEVEPQLIDLSMDRDPSNDDLHLQPDSPLVDAGDPITTDPDGSPSDIGTYGGENADFSYYADEDGDGMYDGWELQNGLDPSLNDAEADWDGDGLSNAGELEYGTDPQAEDSDGDGVSDGEEVALGSDPDDWFSQPGVQGTAMARVPEDFPTIQSAIDFIGSSGTIEVAVGMYLESIEILSKEVTLLGATTAEEVILTGTGGSVVTVRNGTLLLKDITITGGDADDGGGISLVQSIGSMEGIIITGSSAADTGGGLYAIDSDLTLVDSQILENLAYEGGGLAAVESKVVLNGVVLGGNHALNSGGGVYLSAVIDTQVENTTISQNQSNNAGGGLRVLSSVLSVTGTTLSENASEGSGGAAYFSDSYPTLENISVIGNRAQNHAGGIFLKKGGGSLTRCGFSENRSEEGGGALYLLYAAPTIQNSIFTANIAQYGGGLYLYGADPNLLNLSIVGNIAEEGGGLFSYGSAPVIINSVLAYNDQLDLSAKGSVLPTVTYSNLYNLEESHDLELLDPSNLQVRPEFLVFINDWKPSTDELHLLPDSLLIDAGDPDRADPDGSRSDMGAYGGPDADVSYYDDGDNDGMYDGWEDSHGLDLQQDDADADPDQDGVTNGLEFLSGLSPTNPDSDRDGAVDGLELDEGSDPLNWYSQPGVAGTALAVIPGDFDTIQEAIDRAVPAARLQLATGTWTESVGIFKRQIALSGAGAGQTFLKGDGDRVLTASHSTLDLSGLTLMGGQAENGGCLYQQNSDVSLSAMQLTACIATLDGGGIYAEGGSLLLTDVEVGQNIADDDGAGLYLRQITVTILDSVLRENLANNLGGGLYGYEVLFTATGSTFADNDARVGGGLLLDVSQLGADDLEIVRNSALDGGGMYLDQSSGYLSNSILENNLAEDDGAALFHYYGTVLLDGNRFAHNRAQGDGGAIFSASGDLSSSSDRFQDNSAAAGGALYAYSGSLDAQASYFQGNRASTSGGALFIKSAGAQFETCTFRDNEATTGGALYASNDIRLSQSTIAGNVAITGGGLYLSGSSAQHTIYNSALVFNSGMDLVVSTSSPPSLALTYSDLYNGGESHNLDSMSPTNVQVDPGFMAFSNDRNADNDDLHLHPSSPLIDAGDPSILEPDGSVGDIGAYGGLGIDTFYYQDADGDGMYDGWEALHGLDTHAADGDLDLDGDGVSNAQEFELHLDPQSPDTDGDGISDGMELEAGSDPTDWYSQPGSDQIQARVPEDFSTIQAAIDAGTTGARIAVGPGLWEENLSIYGKTVALFSTDGPEESVLQGVDGSVISIGQANVEITGFTITGGDAVKGGGLKVSDSEGRLENLVITGNRASDDGGGLYLSGSEVSLVDCTLSSNDASKGGGLFLINSSPTMDSVRVTLNQAINGGGLFLEDAYPLATGLEVRDNDASEAGGGLYLDSSSPALNDSTIAGNTAGDDGGGLFASLSSPSLTRYVVSGNMAGNSGGGLYLYYSAATGIDGRMEGNDALGAGGGVYANASDIVLRRALVRSNQAESNGGGVSVFSGSIQVSNTQFVRNRSQSKGGGFYGRYADVAMTNTNLVGNRGDSGGGIYLDSGSSGNATIVNSILAKNIGMDLFFDNSPPSVTYSVFHNIGPSHNLEVLDPTNLEVDPGFMAFQLAWPQDRDDLHLHPDSPLNDAGSVSTESSGATDPDGSPTDIGAYGGSGADFSYYADQDGDQIYDGWEVLNLLDTSLDDGALDPDQDGATHREEFLATSNPNQADSDGDGFDDGEEILAERDPNDWFSQPGVEGIVVVRVPEDFATIQQALDFVQERGRVAVDTGVWSGSLSLEGKDVALTGTFGAAATVLEGDGDSVLSLKQGHLELRGFTIWGGSASYGGGVALRFVEGILEDLVIRDNDAVYDGGGVFTSDSSITILQVQFITNSADRNGGGLSSNYGDTVVDGCTFEGNFADDFGGGLYESDGTIAIVDAHFESNDADYGGGLRLSSANGSVVTTTIMNNQAYRGGGIYLYGGVSVLDQLTITGNDVSSSTGGVYVNGTDLVMTGSISAYNDSYQLYRNSGTIAVEYSDIFSLSDEAHNLGTLSSTNLELDPGFLGYDTEGLPSDVHLALGSPLVDMGHPDRVDPDGSRADMGCFGGDAAGTRDLDGDGYFDYFWPGTIQDAPTGFDPTDYDVDDGDGLVH